MKAEHQEQLVFTNDFKIRFCNGYHALHRHQECCSVCARYLRDGEGDLCEGGKRAITISMVLQDEPESEKAPIEPACICGRFPSHRKLARCPIHGLGTKAHMAGCTCRVDSWGHIVWCVLCR